MSLYFGKIVFGFLVIVIIVCVILALTTKSNNQSNQSNQTTQKQIEKFTMELFTIINAMSNVKCITTALRQANTVILQNNTDAQKLIAEPISGKPLSPDSIQKYNNAFNLYTSSYAKLVDCTTYCPQADSSSGNCVCPSAYPIPIQVGDKLYCSSEDCSTVPNATFVPSTSNDPSLNKCDCITGYVKDPSGGSYCYSTATTNTLTNYLNNLNTSFNNISNAQPVKVFGTYKNAAGTSMNMISQSDVPAGSTKVTSTTRLLSSIDCANECLRRSDTNSFSFDVSTQTCTLYSNSPTISQIDVQNSNKVVGTKNLLVYPIPTAAVL
jgi:hypothetical protein